jgi:phosphatidylglycerophosphatase A
LIENDMKTNKLKYLLATGFGTGYSPYASGTVGSLAACLLFIFIPLDDYIWLAISIAMFFIGIWVSGIVEKDIGKDPGIVVIDEFVGQWIALLFLPKTIWILIAGFLVFRILDIIKPFPAADLEELDGGVGIMLDDVIAGIYTNIALHLTLIFLS